MQKIDKFIPQMEPIFGEEEKNSINIYMDEGGWITEFRRTKKFEEMIAEYTGAKHCIVTNNGTISLTLIAYSLGIRHDDEVIVPNYTMIATPNSVKILGAKPVFVDVERETLCMDFEKMKKALTKKTKAIMFVNANGRYPKTDIKEYLKFAEENGLYFIEDSAQSLGSRYRSGEHQGTLGTAGSFSFSSPKIITTGQGGAIITNDDDVAFKIRKSKDFGRTTGGNDIHDSIGFNFKFTELQACIGIEQMKKLEWRVNRKKEILRDYKDFLKSINEVQFFEQDLKHTTPWFIDVLAERRNDLINYLKDNNIGTRVMYPPINKQEAYKIAGEHEVSNLIGEKGLWLPSSCALTKDEIEYICQVIIKFYNK